MKSKDPLFEHEFQTLLERCRVIPHVPEGVRARSLARARTVAGRAADLPMQPVPLARRRGLVTALAASLAFVIGAGAAAAAFYVQARKSQPTAPRELPTLREPRLNPPAPSPAADPEASLPDNGTPVRSQRSGHMASPQESYAAEVRLLQRAQAAYASRHFANALTLAAEHHRRFPNGRLTEEREALRVRALSKAGRTDEAEGAAKAFAERFPRSVLLPRLTGEHK